MEEKQYVTLEEMEELFAKEASKFELDLPIQLPERRKLVPVPSMMGPLLERHLYAERLLQRDYREVDWSNECPLPALISEFAKIWMFYSYPTTTTNFRTNLTCGDLTQGTNIMFF